MPYKKLASILAPDGSLTTVLLDHAYEDFFIYWTKYESWFTEVLPYEDSYLGMLFFFCLQKNKLRAFSLFLKTPAIPLALNREKIDSSYCGDFFSSLPISIILRNYENGTTCDGADSGRFHYNCRALIRLILYCRGIEPFLTIRDRNGKTAQDYYDNTPALTIVLKQNPSMPTETVKTFIERAWKEVRAHYKLLQEARKLAASPDYTQAYEIFHKAALMLCNYSEDEDLNCFYEERRFDIYKEAVELMGSRDLGSMLNYIYTKVRIIRKYLPPDHESVKYFEDILNTPSILLAQQWKEKPLSAIPAYMQARQTPPLGSDSDDSGSVSSAQPSPETLRASK